MNFRELLCIGHRGAMGHAPGNTLKSIHKALELGATDDGPPGERLPIFYGAYVRDLDGNKLCFFEMKFG